MSEVRKHITPEQAQYLQEAAVDYAAALSRHQEIPRMLMKMLGIPDGYMLQSIDYATGEVVAMPPQPKPQPPLPDERPKPDA